MGETADCVAAMRGDRFLHEWEHGSAADLHERQRSLGDVWFWRDADEPHVCAGDKSAKLMQWWHASRFVTRPF